MFRSRLFLAFQRTMCILFFPGESPGCHKCLLGKSAVENKQIPQADLKDIPFCFLLMVEGDGFESGGTGGSMANCLTPQEFSEKLCHLVVGCEAFTKSCSKLSLSVQ